MVKWSEKIDEMVINEYRKGMNDYCFHFPRLLRMEKLSITLRIDRRSLLRYNLYTMT